MAHTASTATAATSVSIEGEDSVVVFRDLQLTAKVEPENASGPYTWSSSNEEVLTVDGNGKVTGKKTGTATVMLVVGSGETAKSASKEIKVTASKKETDEALVYNLLEPGKTASSNDVSNWNGPLGKNAKVDVTGAYWTDGKNCFDNVADRVVQWPDGYDNEIVPRSDPQWDTIFENYKKDTLKKLADAGITGIDIEKTDVEKIELVPAKISKGNGTNPDKHLDCTVVVHCKGIATAIFKLKDAKPNASFEQVGGAPSYLVNGTHNVITNPETITGQEFPLHKKVGDVEYTFSGWYTNDKLEGDAVNFSNGYALHEGTTTFYAKYTAGYQVKYELDGGSWGNSDSTQYTADEGSTQVVKAEPHKDGYEFIGWTVDGLSGTTTLESGQTFTMPGNEVKFTANWRANEVTVTITGHTGTRTYDGTEQQVTGYDVTTSNPEYKASDFTFTGTAKASRTDVGTTNMGLKAEQFQNTSKNFTNVMFKVRNGQLTIDRYAILITPDDVTTEYSGKAPEVVKYTIDGEKPEGLLLDHRIASYETYGSGVDVGEYDQFSMNNAKIVDGNNNDVTKNYSISYEESKLVIIPAPLKITTNSAEKTYDGSALTAGGKIEFTEDGKTVTVADNANGMVQLKNGETVTFTVTGSQTEVGESQNTYEIKWNGSAKETNYTIAEEDVTIGTLKVNARSSGGGSSSKPTPEEEPTPTPTPTPLPTLPTTPAPTTPARRVTRSTATVTQPASRPTEQITENETPKAESEPEVIEDEETPLAPMANGKWALVNLVLMILTVLASLLMLLGVIGKKRGRNNKSFWRIASLIPAIGALAAFVLTENMKLPMAMVDRWTLLMVIIAVLQLIVAAMSKKQNESEDDGANA